MRSLHTEMWQQEVPLCIVGRNADQTGIPTTTNTAVGWNVDLWDPWSMHDPATNNSRITIPNGIRGIFGVVFMVMWNAYASPANTQHEVWLKKSGSDVYGSYDSKMATQTARTMTSMSFTFIGLEAGEYVEALVYHDTGANRSLRWDWMQMAIWLPGHRSS